MARRGNAKVADEQPTPEVELTDETTTEAPAEATEAPTEKAEEKPIDLTDFQTASNAAVEAADESTGDVPQESIDAVNETYRAIEGMKGKNQARSWLDDQMKAAIMDREVMRARAFVMVKDGLSAGSGGGAKAPADPSANFVQRVAALTIAVGLVTENVPEGVSENWAEEVEKLVAELTPQVEAYQAFKSSDDEDAEAPEVSTVVRSAFKLAAGKGSGSGIRASGGPRRDIEKHLLQVFENEPIGAFKTVAEIAKSSSPEYGEDRPSAGAVSARLFPKGKAAYDANGLQATESTDGKPRGATKVA